MVPLSHRADEGKQGQHYHGRGEREGALSTCVTIVPNSCNFINPFIICSKVFTENSCDSLRSKTLQGTEVPDNFFDDEALDDDWEDKEDIMNIVSETAIFLY